MVKKLFYLGAGGLLVSLLLFGRSAVSYIRTSAGYVKDSVEQSVPIEFQIQRAKTMIKDLVPEVRKNMHLIAKEEVELQRLDEQIATNQTRLAKDKAELMRLRSDLAAAKGNLHYGDRDYTPGEVKTDLAHRFERYKTSESTLGSLKDIRNARQKSLAAARERLEGMLASKRQLLVEVENLEARTQMVAAAESTSKYQFDDSQLGRVKELVADLQTRLDVAEKLVNAENSFHDEIPVDKAAPGNIVEQLGQYFGEKAPDAAAVAKR